MIPELFARLQGACADIESCCIRLGTDNSNDGEVCRDIQAEWRDAYQRCNSALIALNAEVQRLLAEVRWQRWVIYWRCEPAPESVWFLLTGYGPGGVTIVQGQEDSHPRQWQHENEQAARAHLQRVFPASEGWQISERG